ncbi:hypothetical protein V5E97_09845 [Singulisphaera sp. Ch08]|uniref:Uncharacterized protein n=1 Tax=Singulisphaera sp. Ch08 TaxID=3120278 RepID=A0AAU7CN27_9BACT
MTTATQEQTARPGRSTPIDSRTLPAIDGSGLTIQEWFRVNGCRNRAKAAYAVDSPMAEHDEIEYVGRKAAQDELRRTLKDRPVAPELAKPAPVIETPIVIPNTHDREAHPMTTAELLARREELQAELTTAPDFKRETPWYRDRVNALERVDRQLARLGLAPADRIELAAQAAAWNGDRTEGASQPHRLEVVHDEDDELWWGENGPTRFDHFALHAD